MNRVYRLVLLSVFLTATVTLAACGRSGGRGDIAHGPPAGAWEETTSPGSARLTEHETRLRGLVAQTMREAREQAATRRNAVVYRRPYYFREFEEYPQGPEAAVIEIRETDSRISPLAADVNVEKIRYATRMHRRKDGADHDTHFVRDTGTESIAYEFRNGRWLRTGSLFVAQKTEEEINGEWVPVQRVVERTIASEDAASESWWRRAWDRVTGR